MGNINAWKEKRDREDAEDKARQMAAKYDIFIPKPGDVMTQANMPDTFPTMGWFQVWKYNLTDKQRNQIPGLKFHIGNGAAMSLRERAQLPMTSHERPPITQQEAEDYVLPLAKDAAAKGFEHATGKRRGGSVFERAHHHHRHHKRIK